MSLVKIQGNASGTGEFTIAAPNSNTNRTLTLPDNTGTVITTGSTFAGTGPAFSAYASTNQTISASTNTKIVFGTEEFDTNNCFASSTFTPTVAGYYQVNIGAGPYGSGEPSRQSLLCFKNGSTYKRLQDVATPTSSAFVNAFSGSCLVYCNGTTDYIEAYILIAVKSGTPVIDSSNGYTFFQASMVRAA